MSKVADYAQFAKLRLSSLVVFSAIISYVIGCRQQQHEVVWMELIGLCLGGFLVTGASNGFNQVIERETDKLMTRTQNRPLPRGRMSVGEGIIFASLMGIAGLTLLYVYTNPLCTILGATAMLLYVAVYTPLKKITPFAVFVGAFPGAVPPMLGCVAATTGFGSIGIEALLLFSIQFMWQFPHFWAIAWVADDDYRKAGFHLLPSRGGRDKSSAFQVLTYTFVLIPVSMMPLMFHMTSIFPSLFILACGVAFAFQSYQLFRDCDVRSATRLMFGSFLYLPLVQIALLFT